MKYILIVVLLLFVTISHAEQICFEWDPYVQTEVIADKFTVHQDDIIYIDDIAVDSIRACIEIPKGDKSCHNYWVQAWRGEVSSEINPEHVAMHCFGGRPGGHSGFFIIQLRKPQGD